MVAAPTTAMRPATSARRYSRASGRYLRQMEGSAGRRWPRRPLARSLGQLSRGLAVVAAYVEEQRGGERAFDQHLGEVAVALPRRDAQRRLAGRWPPPRWVGVEEQPCTRSSFELGHHNVEELPEPRRGAFLHDQQELRRQATIVRGLMPFRAVRAQRQGSPHASVCHHRVHHRVRQACIRMVQRQTIYRGQGRVVNCPCR